MQIYKDIKLKAKNAKKITIFTHLRPDGDSICSAIALKDGLCQINKNISIVSIDKNMPKNFDFLDGFSKIKHEYDGNSELIVCVDCGSFDRIGIVKQSEFLIVIDHHSSNKGFGDINLIDASSPSTTAVVYDLLSNIDVNITKNIAEAVYAGLMSDTDFFRNSVDGCKIFELASELLNFGVSHKKIYENLRQRDSLAKYRAMRYVLETLELHKDAEISTIEISLETLDKSGAKNYELHEMAQLGIKIACVKIALMFIEESSGVKISIRTEDEIADKIALQFGGGGHKMAAGCFIDTDLKDAKNRVITFLKEKNFE